MTLSFKPLIRKEPPFIAEDALPCPCTGDTNDDNDTEQVFFIYFFKELHQRKEKSAIQKHDRQPIKPSQGVDDTGDSRLRF